MLGNLHVGALAGGYGYPMAACRKKPSPIDCPEFAVRAEVIISYTHPPISRSTFHKLVNKNRIVPVEDLGGYYLLNASLKLLGLREVRELPKEPEARSLEDIARLAFTAIDPLTFPEPSWADAAEGLDMNDVDHARLLFNLHREFVEELETPHERLHYFAGVLDAQVMIEADGG